MNWYWALTIAAGYAELRLIPSDSSSGKADVVTVVVGLGLILSGLAGIFQPSPAKLTESLVLWCYGFLFVFVLFSIRAGVRIPPRRITASFLLERFDIVLVWFVLFLVTLLGAWS